MTPIKLSYPHTNPARRVLEHFGLDGPRSGARVQLNGKPVQVEWSDAAEAALVRRSVPLIVELELYYSCLVKKFVHFHEVAPAFATVAVTDKLRIGFRAVTSTECSMDLAQQLGRQPEIEIDTPVVHRLAPKQVWLDHRHGAWLAQYRM
jgi:hypothetical protein